MALTDELVDAARSGDVDAVGVVYRALAPKVQAYLSARGAEDPEGLTSEVFVAVIPRLPKLTGGAAGLRTLVFSVAHARYVDEVRRRNRWPAQTPYEHEDDVRSHPSAESTVVERHSSDRMIALLDQLGEDQRTVISLRVLGDLSLEETARVIGKSTGAVKQLQRRGLLALKALLAQDSHLGEVAP